MENIAQSRGPDQGPTQMMRLGVESAYTRQPGHESTEVEKLVAGLASEAQTLSNALGKVGEASLSNDDMLAIQDIQDSILNQTATLESRGPRGSVDLKPLDLPQIMKLSFGKVFHSAVFVKGALAPGRESFDLVDATDSIRLIVSSQVDIISSLAKLSTTAGQQIITSFRDDVLGAQSMDYLQLLAFFQILSKSPQLQRQAVELGMVQKMLRLLPRFLAGVNVTRASLDKTTAEAGSSPQDDRLMQLEEQPGLLDIWQVPQLNQAILDSYNQEEEQDTRQEAGAKKQNFNLNLQGFLSSNVLTGDRGLESHTNNLAQYSGKNEDTGGGIRSQFYRGGASQSRRLTQMTQQDAAISIRGPAHYKSLDGRRKQHNPESSHSPQRVGQMANHNVIPGGGMLESRSQLTHQDKSNIGSQDSAGGPAALGGVSPILRTDLHSATNNSMSVNRKISQTAIQDHNLRQNIHKMTQMNKLSFARAASEPPQPITSGILNSKSIILPVQEEAENARNEGEEICLQDPRSAEPRPENRELRRGMRDHIEHLNQQITQKDLKKSQLKTQKLGSMANSQELQGKDQKKRNSSSFVVNTFFNFNLQSQKREKQQHLGQLVANTQLSALSSHVSDTNHRNSSVVGTPGHVGGGANSAVNHTAAAGYQIMPPQNQLAMTRLSRRQLSQGQNQLHSQVREQHSQAREHHSQVREHSQVMQTASNQVIAAYGDPRDQRFTSSQGQGSNQGTKSKGDGSTTPPKPEEEDKQSIPTKSDPESSKGGSSKSSIDSKEDGLSENQDIINDNASATNLSAAKSPMIPKLNFNQINQNSKMGKQRIDSQLGHSNILTTPGQHQNMNNVALVQGAPAPLTSHYPLITSCSPGKRGEQIFGFMDASNRTSAIIPIQVGSVGGAQRMLTSFTNAVCSAGLRTGVKQERADMIQTNSVDDDPRRGRGMNFRKMSCLSKINNRHTLSFKQQRNNLILKIQQWHTNTQNNSDINRQEGLLDQEEMISGQNILSGLINNDANGTNGSNGTNTGHHNNRSNSLKILDGMAQSTLNPFGGTQASNIIGMNLDSGAVHNMGGMVITNKDGQIIGNNSTAKIHEIATQLGETFLAKDIACIVQQQRDMELTDLAKQCVAKQEGPLSAASSKQVVTPVENVQRSKSMFISNSGLGLLRKKSEFVPKTPDQAPLGEPVEALEVLAPQNRELVRLTALNIINLLLGKVSAEEMKNIKHTYPLLGVRTFVSSKYFQYSRLASATQVLKEDVDKQGRRERLALENAFTLNPFGRKEVDESEGIHLESEHSAALGIMRKFQFANEQAMKQYLQAQFSRCLKTDDTVPTESKEGIILSKSELRASEEEPEPNMKSPHVQEQQRAADDQQFFDANCKTDEARGKRALLSDLQDSMSKRPRASFAQTQMSTAGLHMPREVLKRKIDILLYTTCQSIKNLIVRQTQEGIHGYLGGHIQLGTPGMYGGASENMWTDPSFAQNLTKEIVVLCSCIEGDAASSPERTRVLLRQIVDVGMEALLMIKRILIDVSLRQKFFIIDQTKQILPLVQQELLSKGRIVDNQLFIQDFQSQNDLENPSGHDAASSMNNANELNLSTEIQCHLAITQMCFRHLFSEYLRLLSLIMGLPHTCDTLKLFNELFVCNSAWQETVKNFAISMWLQDVVSPTLVAIHWRYGSAQFRNFNLPPDQQPNGPVLTLDQKCIIYENLETLRGINANNFSHQDFMQQIDFIDTQANILLLAAQEEQNKASQPLQLAQVARTQIELVMSQLVSVMEYYHGVPKFLKKAIDIFFPPYFYTQAQQQKQQQKSQLNQPHLHNHQSELFRGHTRNMRQMTSYEDTSQRNLHNESGLYSANPYLGGGDFSGRQANDCSALEGPSNPFSAKGVTSEQKYWKNAVRTVLFQMQFWFTNTNGLLNQFLFLNASNYKVVKVNQNLIEGDTTQYCNSINFRLTQTALRFLKQIFDFNEKFTKYVFVDEIIVFFVRTHHTNFVKLYNKSKSYLAKLKTIENKSQQRKLEMNYKNANKLCKQHLKCLYSLAKNRNESSRMKFFQFSLVPFIAQELSLEYDFLQQRKKFLSVGKKAAKEANEADFFEMEDESPSKVKRSSHVLSDYDNASTVPKMREREQKSLEQGYILAPQVQPGYEFLHQADVPGDIQYNFRDVFSDFRQGHPGEIGTPLEEEKNADPTLASATPGGTIPSNEYEPPPMTTEGCSVDDDYRDPPESAHSVSNLLKQKSKFMSNQLPDIKSETELQTHSNKFDESKMESHGTKGSQEGTQNPQDFALAEDDSDSDLGLPPPLPLGGPKPGLGLSLALGGLGLSTVAQDGGKTAEQMADEETLINAINQKKKGKAGSESSDTSDEEGQEASQPPPKAQPFVPPLGAPKVPPLGAPKVPPLGGGAPVPPLGAPSPVPPLGAPSPVPPLGAPSPVPPLGAPAPVPQLSGGPPIPPLGVPSFNQGFKVPPLGGPPVPPLGQPNPVPPLGFSPVPPLGGPPVPPLGQPAGMTGPPSDMPTPQAYDSSDSDAGLPPMIPMAKPTGLPSLSLGGLGLSTLAGAGGKTAEEMADMEVLNESKAQQQNRQAQADDTSSSESESVVPEQQEPIPIQDQKVIEESKEESRAESDSDDGLPPPIMQTNPLLKFGIPSLGIGGLGLSTVAGADGRTAEEAADAAILREQNQNAGGAQPSSSEDDSDSDAGLPPPLPIQSTGMKLNIAGLGLSTVATHGGKTAEEQADHEVLQASKAEGHQRKDDSSDSSESSDREEVKEDPQEQEEDISSDEEYYRELERIKALGGQNQAPLEVTRKDQHSNSSQHEGGQSLSSYGQFEGGDSETDPSAQKCDTEGPSKKFNTIDQQKPEKVFHDRHAKGAQKQPQAATANKPSTSNARAALQSAGLTSSGKNLLQASEQTKLMIKGGKLHRKINTNKLSNRDNQADPNNLANSSAPPEVDPSKKRPITLIQKGALPSKQLKSAQQKLPLKISKLQKPQPAALQISHPQPPVSQVPQQLPGDSLAPEDLQSQGTSERKEVKKFGKNPSALTSSQLQQVQELGKKSTTNSQSLSGAAGPSRKRNEGQGNFKTQVNADQRPNIGNNLNLNIPQQLPQHLHHPEEGVIEGGTNTHVGADSIAFQFQSQTSSINLNETKQHKVSRRVTQEQHKKPMVIATNNLLQANLPDQARTFFDQVAQEASSAGVPKINHQLGLPTAEGTPNNPSSSFRKKKEVKFSDPQLLKEEPAIPHPDVRSEQQKPRLRGSSQQKHLSTNFLHPSGLGVPAANPAPLITKTKSFRQKKMKAAKVSKDDFLSLEREKRPVYQDKELHTLMLSLILCLFLQPQRGTLDELYCQQYPLNEGKNNYLYILHQHLSHERNQYLIGDLLEKVAVSPPLAGQRLLKLMCPALFDIGLYNNGKDWKKLAVGAYGTVYSCKTDLVEPKSVAIKQMDLPTDIYDRSVLHDIFTEITCLEEFRLEKCVTDLYDYGVDRQSYYIVMKKYSCSLGEWRRGQGDSIDVFKQNLGLYVSIYNKVLRSLKTIHSHNVTHYDLKCDNVLISFNLDDENKALESQREESNIPNVDLRNLTEDDFEITIGDFGECKIFSNDKDEFCTRNRGTDSIKSPEMLQLTINTRKDHDKYDRRKQVGTNRLSDIWSVGCLFYELLTGEFLLYHPDWAHFFVRVISHTQELIPEEKLEKIDNNQYIRDFLKFILIRDQRLRPTIDKVIQRFEHIHAILCNVGVGSSPTTPHEPMTGPAVTNPISGNRDLQNCLRLASEVQNQTPTDLKKGKNHQISRVLEGIFVCSHDYFEEPAQLAEAIHLGITHVVISVKHPEIDLSKHFEVCDLEAEFSKFNHLLPIGQQVLNGFRASPIFMDFLRRTTLYKGRVLIVDRRQDNLMKETLLIALNHIFRTNSYETYTLIRSQNVFFQVDRQQLALLSQWNLYLQRIRQYLATFPQFSCHCGASLIILERAYAQYSNVPSLIGCSCQPAGGPRQVAGPHNHYKTCPCSGNPLVSCSQYLDFLTRYYQTRRTRPATHISPNPISHSNQLLWAYVDPSDFILGPNPSFGGSKGDNFVAEVVLDEAHQVTGSLSKRSYGGGSTMRSGKPTIPKIPIAQALSSAGKPPQHSRGSSRLGLRPNESFVGGAGSERQSARPQVSKINHVERMLASNLSRTIDVNSESVATKTEATSFLKEKPEFLSAARPAAAVVDSAGHRHTTSSHRSSARDEENMNFLVGTLWDIKKCSICNCWTHAYSPTLNKFAVVLNNRLHQSNQGLLSQKNSSSSTLGMTNNLEAMEKHFAQLKEEFVRQCQVLQRNQDASTRLRSGARKVGPNSAYIRYQNGDGAVGSGRPSGRADSYPYPGVSGFATQGGGGPDVSITGGDASHLSQLRGGLHAAEQMNLSLSQIVDFESSVTDFGGVRVPILENIQISLPF